MPFENPSELNPEAKTHFYIEESGKPRPGETRYPDHKIMQGAGGLTWKDFKKMQRAADYLINGDTESGLAEIRSTFSSKTEAGSEEVAEALEGIFYGSGSELINSLLLQNYIVVKLRFDAMERAEDDKRVELAKGLIAPLYETLAQAYRLGTKDIIKEFEEKLTQVKDIISENEIVIGDAI